MTLMEASPVPSRSRPPVGGRRPCCRIPGSRRSSTPAAKHADLGAVGDFGGQRLEVVTLQLFPFLLEPHDRVRRHCHLVVRGARKAPDEDRFDFLPVQHGAPYGRPMCWTVIPPTNIAKPSRPTASPTGSMTMVTLRPRPSTIRMKPPITKNACSATATKKCTIRLGA